MTDSFEKYERGNQVAVLVSPGFGAGWATWNSGHLAQAAMDKRFVELALGERKGEIDKICKEVFGPDSYAYCGGWEDVRVQWVTKGERFEIREYDGSETLHVFGPDDGMLA